MYTMKNSFENISHIPSRILTARNTTIAALAAVGIALPAMGKAEAAGYANSIISTEKGHVCVFEDTVYTKSEEGEARQTPCEEIDADLTEKINGMQALFAEIHKKIKGNEDEGMQSAIAGYEFILNTQLRTVSVALDDHLHLKKLALDADMKEGRSVSSEEMKGAISADDMHDLDTIIPDRFSGFSIYGLLEDEGAENLEAQTGSEIDEHVESVVTLLKKMNDAFGDLEKMNKIIEDLGAFPGNPEEEDTIDHTLI